MVVSKIIEVTADGKQEPVEGAEPLKKDPKKKVKSLKDRWALLKAALDNKEAIMDIKEEGGFNEAEQEIEEKKQQEQEQQEQQQQGGQQPQEEQPDQEQMDPEAEQQPQEEEVGEMESSPEMDSAQPE